MSSEDYLKAACDALDQLRQTQKPAIDRAAEIIADAIASGAEVFSFGATHSFIPTMEMVYRTGGLILVNPIEPHGMHLGVRPLTLTSQLERLPDFGRVLLENSPAKKGDVLILASTSGRNHIVIDMALAAVEKGLTVIGVTSVAYAESVPSRHPCGKKLHEICRQVIDNCAPAGDAAVEIPGFPQKTGPLSTVLGCAAVNAAISQVIRLLVERGMEPPVFVSANLPGGDEHNAKLLAEYRDRIHYL